MNVLALQHVNSEEGLWASEDSQISLRHKKVTDAQAQVRAKC